MPEGKFDVKMVLDRSTPGTHLYKAPMQQSAVVKNVYVGKDAFETPQPPREITVTVTYQQ